MFENRNLVTRGTSMVLCLLLLNSELNTKQAKHSLVHLWHFSPPCWTLVDCNLQLSFCSFIFPCFHTEKVELFSWKFKPGNLDLSWCNTPCLQIRSPYPLQRAGSALAFLSVDWVHFQSHLPLWMSVSSLKDRSLDHLHNSFMLKKFDDLKDYFYFSNSIHEKFNPT